MFLCLLQINVLVAGGCDDSCHEHLDDTLFFSFATQSWQTLPAKVIISNCTFPFVMSLRLRPIKMSIFWGLILYLEIAAKYSQNGNEDDNCWRQTNPDRRILHWFVRIRGRVWWFFLVNERKLSFWKISIRNAINNAWEHIIVSRCLKKSKETRKKSFQH